GRLVVARLQRSGSDLPTVPFRSGLVIGKRFGQVSRSRWKERHAENFRRRGRGTLLEWFHQPFLSGLAGSTAHCLSRSDGAVVVVLDAHGRLSDLSEQDGARYHSEDFLRPEVSRLRAASLWQFPAPRLLRPVS